MSIEQFEMIKLVRPLVAYDLETHDLVNGRIVEIGFKMIFPDSDRPPKVWGSMINPEVPISAAATAIHGITDADVQLRCWKCRRLKEEHPTQPSDEPCITWRACPTFRQIAANLAKGLRNVDFCGYNIKFDLKVTDEEMQRVKQEWSYEGANLLDGLRLWQVLEPRHLSDAVQKFLGRPPTDSHRALGDAEDALEVVLAQLDLLNPADRRSVVAVHQLCFSKNPSWIDADGKFVWKGNEAIISFGKHAGAYLKHVPKDYLQWMRGGSFSSEVKQICSDAIEGKFPVRPSSTSA